MAEDKVTFSDCLVECAMNKEFIANFNRLMKCNVSFEDKRHPIEKMIDEATKNPVPYKIENKDDEMMKFVYFVWECVWSRLQLENRVCAES